MMCAITIKHDYVTLLSVRKIKILGFLRSHLTSLVFCHPQSYRIIDINMIKARGHSLKICDGYVRPNWPPFSNRLSLNDPFLFFTFCSHLMTPIFKMLSHLMTPFFRNIGENGRHALTERCPFSSINDHLVICTQYLFGRRDLCSC